jgi:hypothetical protein
VSLAIDFTPILTDQLTLWTEKSKEWDNDLKKKKAEIIYGG